MLEITYPESLLMLTAAWIAVRAVIAGRRKTFSPAGEARLLPVYVCLAVIMRIVYFPWHLVNGKIGTLNFDPSRILPFWLNLVPFVHMFEIYDGWQLNLFGNAAMFIPVGIMWPICFKKLDTFGKTLAAGAGLTLCIEVSQLLFYERSSDIDDVILNSLGAAIGALIFFACRRPAGRKRR